MIEELKKCLLIEQRNRVASLRDEKNALIDERKNCYNTKMEYKGRINAVFSDSRLVEFDNHYSKISKFFNKKKYLQEYRQLGNSVKEDLNRKMQEEEEKMQSIDNRIKEIDAEIIEITNNLSIIDKAKYVNELSISFDYAKELLTKNNINIFDYSTTELFNLGVGSDQASDVEFMKKAISESPFNIIYDQTDNFDMYYNFISSLHYREESVRFDRNSFENNKNNILAMLNKSKNGEIRIKPTYLVEAIRFYFKDVIIDAAGLLNKGKTEDIYEAIDRISKVYNSSLQLSDGDYYKLESMYNKEKNDYYCHQTSGNVTEEKLNSILSEGLNVSHEWVTTCRIGANARKVDCFLALAGYQNFYGGHRSDGENYRIIIEIPKGTERPIGSDKDDGEKTHILPDYVIAYTHDRIDNHGNITNASLLMNNMERKKYRYYYRDGYNPQNPLAFDSQYLLKENIEGRSR